MNSIVSPATERMLQQFLEGQASPSEFEEWLVAAVDDDAMLDAEREGLLRLRLIMTECGERIRPIGELRAEVAALLVKSASATWSGTLPWSPATFELEPRMSATPIGFQA